MKAAHDQDYQEAHYYTERIKPHPKLVRLWTASEASSRRCGHRGGHQFNAPGEWTAETARVGSRPIARSIAPATAPATRAAPSSVKWA